MYRIQDENDDEELFTSLPRQPDVSNHSADTVREELDTTTSPVTVCCQRLNRERESKGRESSLAYLYDAT